MQHFSGLIGRSIALAAGLTAGLVACSSDDDVTTPVLPTAYEDVKLVADVSGLGATVVDPALVNPWGLAFSAGGTIWTSNNRTHTSTLYSGTGVRSSLVVTIPGSAGATAGAPTGIVFNPATNPATDFVLANGNKASFIFSSEDGTITAWNNGSGANAQIVANQSSTGAVYKGLALASNGGANFLYATNFKANKVDVFDRTFKLVSSFTDATVPAGYAPFGIHNINGQLYVTFAKQLAPDNEDDRPGVGNGYVDIFNPDGTLVKRFASNGRLNSPWAVALAPAAFGSAGGNILIGNFGDGQIGAYDATTGVFRGFLHDATNVPISILGLWDLKWGVGSAPATTLYYSAGPSGETHGLLGTLTAK